MGEFHLAPDPPSAVPRRVLYVNYADSKEIQRLLGVSEAYANAIIELRNVAHFRGVGDLTVRLLRREQRKGRGGRLKDLAMTLERIKDRSMIIRIDKP